MCLMFYYLYEMLIFPQSIFDTIRQVIIVIYGIAHILANFTYFEFV